MKDKDSFLIISLATVPWRNDGRCGKKHLNADGKPGECDPKKSANEKGPCCSSGGYCGNSKNHCKCSKCIDFRTKSGKKYGCLEIQIFIL